jgi:hypothetical protein
MLRQQVDGFRSLVIGLGANHDARSYFLGRKQPGYAFDFFPERPSGFEKMPPLTWGEVFFV